MLVIQRSLRKSAPLVESCERPNPQSRRCLTCVTKSQVSPQEEQGSETKDLSFKKDTGAIYLQGKPILLQHRVSSKKQLSYQIYSDQATYANKTNHQRHSAASRERKDWNKSSNNHQNKRITSRSSSNNEENRKIVQQKRKQKARTPLLMSTMNLPNDDLTALMSKETLQAHMSREDAQATLQRLLSTRTHQSASTAKCTTKQFRPLDETAVGQHGASEKSTYLQGSYDYLFQRHYQNLNNVIHQNQEANDTSQVTQRHKKTVDIHQNCCRGGACNKDEQVNFESQPHINNSANTDQGNSLNSDDTYASRQYLTKPDTFFVLRNQVGVLDSSLQEEINSNLNSLTSIIGDSISCRATGDHVSKYNNPVPCGNFKVSASDSAMQSQYLGESLEEETRGSPNRSNDDRKRNGGVICINVSDQFQDIHLEEVEPAITKPVITLNHVSESFSSERQEVLVIRSHSRSPSPLLEVPRATDIHQESLRPPLQ